MIDFNTQQNNHAHRSKVICVLGMHRSGTSCLAGCLQDYGLHLGDVVNAAPHNKKGNKENLTVRGINDLVLAASGGSWDQPPGTLSWNDGLRARRDELISSYANFPSWGFKDPRTLITLPFWLEALPNLHFIGTFRHPTAVAESFEKREGTDPTTAIALWKDYNLKLIEYIEIYNFPLVCFDWSYEKYCQSLLEICAHAGLNEIPAISGFSFYDSKLRHHVSARQHRVPNDIWDIYLRLESAAQAFGD